MKYQHEFPKLIGTWWQRWNERVCVCLCVNVLKFDFWLEWKTHIFSQIVCIRLRVCWCMELASPFDIHSHSLSLSLSLSQMFLCVCFTLNVRWFIVCAAFICYYWTSVAVKTKRLTFRTWCLAFVSWSCSSAVHNALLTAWLYACTEHTSLFPLTTPGLWIPFFHYVL